MCNSSRIVSNQPNRNQMCIASTITSIKTTRAVSAAIRARAATTARAKAKAIQIETYESDRNRTMWNLLKSSSATIYS